MGKISESASQRVSESASQRVGKSASRQVGKSASRQVGKSANNHPWPASEVQHAALPSILGLPPGLQSIIQLNIAWFSLDVSPARRLGTKNRE